LCRVKYVKNYFGTRLLMHACPEEGEVLVWGLNNNGSLGLNHTADQQTPQVLRQLSDEKTIIQAALGGFHTIALHGTKAKEKRKSLNKVQLI